MGERGKGSEILEHSSFTNLTGSFRISTLVLNEAHIHNTVGNMYKQLNIYKYEAQKNYKCLILLLGLSNNVMDTEALTNVPVKGTDKNAFEAET